MTGLLADIRNWLAALALAVIVLAILEGPDNPLVRAVQIITARTFDTLATGAFGG
jgi:hypothetical protein